MGMLMQKHNMFEIVVPLKHVRGVLSKLIFMERGKFMKAAKYHDYYGFICHKDQDKVFAIKLQRKIENYRISTKTRIENGFMTKYIRHIFGIIRI